MLNSLTTRNTIRYNVSGGQLHFSNMLTELFTFVMVKHGCFGIFQKLKSLQTFNLRDFSCF
ncbi:hypothetical protein BEL04_22215 [Mucilaginibacter sp. PPCGB 2223]|nr:hypothetical protein BEL04_22215 [Mucilaginibacter sp. PPCGB 2223]